ncbi:MAG: ABC transporter permease, partial [Vicinamibacterales bacterium]
MWTDLRHRLRAIFRSSAVDGELDDEVAFHLEQYVRSLEQQGASHREAIRRARMEFGTRDEVKEEHREARGISLLPDVARDLQCAFRSLRRTPGATAVAVLSLALSIGATAAVYGTVDWLLNRAPGGVVDPERVVILNTTDREQPGRIGYYFSYQQYLDLIRVQDVFDEVATYAKAIGVAATDGASEQVVFEWVSGNYFAVLGVPPAQGRTFVPEDDWEGVPVVAMISEEFWRTRLLSDPNVLDATLRLNGHPARIIGIVPESFEGFNLDWNGPTDIWVPMQAIKPMGGTLLTTSLASPFIPVFGRLPANMNMNEAMQRAQAWLPQLREHTAVTNYRPTGIVGTPATEMRIARRQQARSFLYVLLMVCALLLLAACFNVANFLVGRAASRRGEIALRAALGASRQRLFRQLLTEATLLGGLGALLGVAAAIVTAQLLADLPRIYLSLPNTRLSTAGSIDYRMAAVAGVLGFVCVLLFGLLPSLMATVRNPIADLKESRAGWSWSRMRITTRHALLVLQIALGVALSVTAGLYAQSFL